MRLLQYLLPAVAGLLAGCADHLPTREARFGVALGYMSSGRRAVEDADRAPVPHYDMSKSCRGIVRNGCLKEEQDAAVELEQRWHTFSAADRSACMPQATGGVEPSYVELLTCVEMGMLTRGPSKIVVGTQR